MHKSALGGLIGAILAISAAQGAPVKIVAAENFYGDIARQIGGADVAVTSILTNPDQDPHDFEASAATARAIADARLFIYNGADYDPWAVKLLGASPSSSRAIITVAGLLRKQAGDNPHLWYLPAAMPVLGESLADTLVKLAPAQQAAYSRRLAAFLLSMRALDRRIAELRCKYAGTPVTATEPVFGYMADALGLTMRNAGFQRAIMNDTEPGAADIARFETDLRSRAVRVLLYNRQTGGQQTRRMREIAEAAGVPVVGVSETEPPDKDYQQWMLSQLDALDRALDH